VSWKIVDAFKKGNNDKQDISKSKKSLSIENDERAHKNCAAVIDI
jgi:hypothetical protein